MIGYVFQDFNLLPGLTAIENASLPLELDGVAVPKARAAGVAAQEPAVVGVRARRRVRDRDVGAGLAPPGQNMAAVPVVTALSGRPVPPKAVRGSAAPPPA